MCFLVMSLLVGLVYKFTAERAGKQSLDDLMNSSLYLMRSELREIPPHDWGKTLKEMDLNLSFDLQRAGQPVPEVVTQLLELELAGWIAAVPGGYVRLRRACHVRRTNVFV